MCVYFLLGLDLEKAVTSVSISDRTAVYRLYIYKYGILEVLRNPIFGIGFNDWARPSAMTDSVDSFWLFNAMRYGIPALLFIGITFAVPICLFLKKINAKNEGSVCVYTLGLIGAIVSLGTVHVWGTAYVFVILFLSSGIFLLSTSASGMDEMTGISYGDSAARRKRSRKRARIKRNIRRKRNRYK